MQRNITITMRDGSFCDFYFSFYVFIIKLSYAPFINLEYSNILKKKSRLQNSHDSILEVNK